MNLFTDLFNNFQQSLSSDPLNFLGIMLTVIASIYIFKSESSLSLIKERHDNLIFPLFDTLEPILFQELDMDILNKALSIIENNKKMADGKLSSAYYNLKENPSQYNFIRLCSYINQAYDKSCRKLKLRTRTIEYRINRNQYKSRITLIFYFSAFFLVSIFIFLIFLCFFFLLLFLVLYIINNFFHSATPQNQLIMIMVAILSLLALFKFINQHY